MNDTAKVIVGAIAGFCTGGVCGYFASRFFLQKQFNEDLNNVRTFYADMNDKGVECDEEDQTTEPIIIEPAVVEPEPEDVVVMDPLAPMTAASQEVQYDKIAEKYSSPAAAKRKPTVKKANKGGPGQHFGDYAEYMSDNGHKKMLLTYFSADNQFLDANDNQIDRDVVIGIIGGEDILDYFYRNGNDDCLNIINNDTNTDVRIVLEERTMHQYFADVNGLD